MVKMTAKEYLIIMSWKGALMWDKIFTKSITAPNINTNFQDSSIKFLWWAGRYHYQPIVFLPIHCNCMDEAVERRCPLSQAETWEKPSVRLIFPRICSMGKGMCCLYVLLCLLRCSCLWLWWTWVHARIQQKDKNSSKLLFGVMSNQYSFGRPRK